MSKRKRKKRKKRKLPKSSSARAPRAWKPGQYSSSSLVSVSHSFGVWLARDFQENWNYLGYDLVRFLRPHVSGSHLFGVHLCSTGLWTFLGDDFWRDSVFSSWFNTGYMFTSV